jgi:hypothetical protein
LFCNLEAKTSANWKLSLLQFFFLSSLIYYADLRNNSPRCLLRCLPRPQDAVIPFNTTRRYSHFGGHPSNYYYQRVLTLVIKWVPVCSTISKSTWRNCHFDDHPSKYTIRYQLCLTLVIKWLSLCLQLPTAPGLPVICLPLQAFYPGPTLLYSNGYLKLQKAVLVILPFLIKTAAAASAAAKGIMSQCGWAAAGCNSRQSCQGQDSLMKNPTNFVLAAIKNTCALNWKCS